MKHTRIVADRRKTPAQANAGLVNGIDCLLRVIQAESPLGGGTLAVETGLGASTANRLLKTLCSIGLLRQERDRKYAPGPGIHMLSALSLRASGLLCSALKPLEKLSAAIGMDVALGVLWQRHVCYLYHGGLHRNLEASVAVNKLYPAEFSSIGRILLSCESDDYVRALYRPLLCSSNARQGRERGRGKTENIAPKRQAGNTAGEGGCAALLRNLADARRNNFAFAEDGRSVAVCVGGNTGAAIAAAGKFTAKDVPALVTQLRQTADKIVTAAEGA